MEDNQERPLLTFMLITFNQEAFVKEALQGAFDQTYEPLEILLSDDCSTDRTFEIIQEMVDNYGGPHKIFLNRSEKNLGMIGNINRSMELANGELIVAAAGDDISLPNRVERVYKEYIETDKKAYSIFSNAIWIDEDGNKMNFLHKKPIMNEELNLENYSKRYPPSLVNGCTHAWKREIFEIFGPLSSDAYTEDLTIPFRSALLGKLKYIHDPLVLYRRNNQRIQNDLGNYSFQVYKNMYKHQKSMQIKMYMTRLNDVIMFEKSNSGTLEKKIKKVKEYTLKRIKTLENKNPSGFCLWLRFIKLRFYYFYQDYFNMIKNKRNKNINSNK